MSDRMVSCVVLNAEAPALKKVPYPGELGQRIFNEVSEDGWAKWIENQTMIINENGLSTVDPTSLKMLEEHKIQIEKLLVHLEEMFYNPSKGLWLGLAVDLEDLDL